MVFAPTATKMAGQVTHEENTESETGEVIHVDAQIIKETANGMLTGIFHLLQALANKRLQKYG